MIGIFIPSYNRPMQLHALLESIRVHDKANLLANIHVRYQGSDTKLKVGYVKVKSNNNFRHVEFKQKSDKGLGYDMLEVMGNSKYKYFVVITDDSVFYRDFHLPYSGLERIFNDEINHFTFRCGYNTTIVDYTQSNIKHELRPFERWVELSDDKELAEKSNVVKFHWPSHTNHYRFPCALDGTLFNRTWILQNTLEAVGPNFDYRKWECKVNELLTAKQERPNALCFETSVLVNSPNNMVSDGPYCKNGEIHKYTVEDLNHRYLAGEKVDIQSIEPNNIISVQQELPLRFVKNEQ